MQLFDDNMLVVVYPKNKTAGGIYLPDKRKGKEDELIRAKVLAVGPGQSYVSHGEFTVKKVRVKVDDMVLLAFPGSMIKIGEVEEDGEKLDKCLTKEQYVVGLE